jgi:ornithine cyclodeaminase/alanine dehydrogenase-like protein (mu-crystallin family)
MGKLGRMHAQLLGDLYPSLEEINCFSRRAAFDDLLSHPRVRKRRSVEDVVDRSEVLITTSAATEPYIFEHHVPEACRLIVNLSLMDCHVDVIKNSDHIVVDDWLQNSRAERVFKTGIDQGLYGRERVSELSEVLFGPRRNYPGRVFVNPLGMGLEDVYVAGKIARQLGVYP